MTNVHIYLRYKILQCNKYNCNKQYFLQVAACIMSKSESVICMSLQQVHLKPACH